VHDVHLAADAPRRPLDAPGEVHDLAVGLGELDVEILQDGVREPTHILRGALHELGEIRDAVLAS